MYLPEREATAMPKTAEWTVYNPFVFSDGGGQFNAGVYRMRVTWPTSAKGGGFRPVVWCELFVGWGPTLWISFKNTWLNHRKTHFLTVPFTENAGALVNRQLWVARPTLMASAVVRNSPVF
jgi:hypothetical protein